MSETNKHKWEMQPSFAAHSSKYICSVCLVKRYYSWTPGWPGWYDYYSIDGSKLEKEPVCTMYPKHGLFDNIKD